MFILGMFTVLVVILALGVGAALLFGDQFLADFDLDPEENDDC